MYEFYSSVRARSVWVCDGGKDLDRGRERVCAWVFMHRFCSLRFSSSLYVWWMTGH